MSRPRSPRHIPIALAIWAAVMLVAMTPAWASVISDTPTLPVLGVPYASSIGAGCFPAAGVCVGAGSIVLTSVVSSTFNPGGQDIVTNVAYSATLTTLGNTPIGPIALSGTMEQEVLGRTFSAELGSWTTDLISLSLSGPLLGHTLSLGLDGSQTSSGLTSIEPLELDKTKFRITSFFDVFVELELDSTPPLTATRGPVRLALGPEPPAGVPEPASLTLLGLGLVGLAWGGRWSRLRAR